jgi:hypothetical protein
MAALKGRLISKTCGIAKAIPDTNPARLKAAPLQTKVNPSLFFERKTKLFNDRVRQNFARDSLYFRVRFVF